MSQKTRTYTERLAEKIITEVVESDVKNVAQRNGLSEKEVETILKEKFSDLETEKPPGLKNRVRASQTLLTKGL